jgi:hypothetical protein
VAFASDKEALADVRKLLQAEEQISIHEVLDSDLLGALLHYLLGGNADHVNADDNAVRNLRTLAGALECDGQGAGSGGGEEQKGSGANPPNPLRALLTWLQAAVASLAEAELLPPPTASASAPPRQRGLGVLSVMLLGRTFAPVAAAAAAPSGGGVQGGLELLNRPLVLRSKTLRKP